MAKQRPGDPTPGQRLLELRTKANLSCEELAAKVRDTGECTCSAAWISLYERGLIKWARGDKIVGLCRALDVEPLLFSGPNRPTAPF